MLLNCTDYNLGRPSELLYIGLSLIIGYIYVYDSDNTDPRLLLHNYSNDG